MRQRWVVLPTCFVFLITASCMVAWAENDDGATDQATAIKLVTQPGRVVISAGGSPLATYNYADPQITRPYLAHVHAPGGIQVTRNHPPQPGDPGDHADYHPGIFLAFGDLSGHDDWRLKAKVVHAGFEQLPQSCGSRGSFSVSNRYLSMDGSETICLEGCKLTFSIQPNAYRIDWDSAFSSPDTDFYFGDQEEMGLGVRVASAIREAGGNGRVRNSKGLESAKQTWGQPAEWCDYAGTISGQHVGVTVMASPSNVRPSWWHNRDYGLFVANLFGRAAMKQGARSRLLVKRGETFRLRYAILLHASRERQPDLDEAYRRYLNSLDTKE